MADIAQTIQQGDRDLQQSHVTAHTMALQTQVMQQQKQAKVDQITDATLLSVEAANKQASAAHKKWEELANQLEDTTVSLTEQQKRLLGEEMEKATTARQAAIDKRNSLISSIAANPSLMIAMDKSSYYNKDIGKKVFSEEYLDSMPEEQKQQVVGQLTALAAAKQQMADRNRVERLSPYETRRQQNLADSEFGKGQKPEEAPDSRIGVLSSQAYESNLVQGGKKPGGSQVKEYYAKDMAQFYSEYDKLLGIGGQNEKFLQKLFSNWAPDTDTENQEDDVKAFDSVLAEYEAAPVKDATTRSIVTKLRDIVASEPEEDRALRLGAFINQMKKLYPPNKLQPRSSAE